MPSFSYPFPALSTTGSKEARHCLFFPADSLCCWCGGERGVQQQWVRFPFFGCVWCAAVPPTVFGACEATFNFPSLDARALRPVIFTRAPFPAQLCCALGSTMIRLLLVGVLGFIAPSQAMQISTPSRFPACTHATGSEEARRAQLPALVTAALFRRGWIERLDPGGSLCCWSAERAV